jgi:hypothetical protein
VLVLLTTVVPALILTTVNMLGFGLLATALLFYGNTRLLSVSAGGAAIVMLELESAWNKHPLALAIAASVAGLALLAAFELRTWSEELARTPSDRGAYYAQARLLATRLALIGLILAALVVAAHGFVHGPTLGIVAGVAVFAVGATVVWLAARVR